MISVVGVRKAYLDGDESHQVLDGVDLEVEAGGFVAVLGASGSGKSTLLHLVGGLDGSFEGEVKVDGLSLRGLDDASLSRFRGRTMGFVFQGFHLIPELSALDNVALPGWFDKEADGDRDAFRQRAEAVLASVGLGGKTHRRPDHLSGGERQRVAIARALLREPKVVLCDEPTGNLDARTGQEIIELFHELNDRGMTLLMVTHEARVADAAGRVVYLSEGRVQEVADRASIGEARASAATLGSDEDLR